MRGRVRGRARGRGGAAALLSRAAAFAAVVVLIGALPWLSGNSPEYTVLRARYADRPATPEVLAQIRTELGLDGGPVAVFADWASGVLTGDLGTSWISGRPVLPGVLEALGVDYIDESEVLTPADEVYHIDKKQFTVPFVCGARDLGEALRRIGEGASMIRTKGEPGAGNVVEAVRHMRMMMSQIRKVQSMSRDELMAEAKKLGAPYDLLLQVHETGRLPVVNFAAGGIATPADAALMMHLGADGVFVGSGIFKSENPEKYAKAIVQAAANYEDFGLIAELSKGLGSAMPGIEISTLSEAERMQERGW